MKKHITAENIIHNMKRYDHQDPHATYSISHIARMIGETPFWTRQKLQEMNKLGLVSSFQNDGVRWKAL
jgi:hypothetical protein